MILYMFNMLVNTCFTISFTVTGLNFDTTVLTSTRFVTVAQNKKKKVLISTRPRFLRSKWISHDIRSAVSADMWRF